MKRLIDKSVHRRELKRSTCHQLYRFSNYVTFLIQYTELQLSVCVSDNLNTTRWQYYPAVFSGTAVLDASFLFYYMAVITCTRLPANQIMEKGSFWRLLILRLSRQKSGAVKPCCGEFSTASSPASINTM